MRNPPATGNADLDRFLSSVKDELETATKPTQGWKLSDFHAEVSEVISDERDLIDIISNWDDINTIKANFETDIARYENLYADSKALGDRYQDHAEIFSQIMEWWTQNVRLIEDIEAFMIEVNADTSDAASSASDADSAAARAEAVADSTHWQDDRLSVMGQLSPPLTGEAGPAGETPHVGANGNWWVGDTDTGMQAQGPKGDPGDGAGNGDVLWSELNPVLDGKAPESHTHTALQISDATTVGRSVLTAASQAVARTAIGAGTSNLALGTTSSTAAAGNHTHTAANITDATTVGRNVLKAADAAAARTAIGAGTSSLVLGAGAGEAAAGNHSHTAASVGAAPATHTHKMVEITDLPAVSQQATASALVQRRGNSQITVPEVPSDPSNAVAMQWVEAQLRASPKLHVWDGSGSWAAPSSAGPNDAVLNAATGEIHSVQEVV